MSNKWILFRFSLLYWQFGFCVVWFACSVNVFLRGPGIAVNIVVVTYVHWDTQELMIHQQQELVM